jgi:5-hydroxyisourate hydrolase
MSLPSLSTHILDTALGRPATGIAVSLARRDGVEWTIVEESRTDADGRIKSLPVVSCDGAEPSIFRLRFATAPYFAALGQKTLYPYVDIVFQIGDGAHYHIPLLLTAHGYTTYRGS